MKKTPAKNIRAVSAFRIDDGHIADLIFDPVTETTAFAVSKDGRIEILASFKLPNGECLVPISAGNNLLKHRAVLLPIEPEPFGSMEALVSEIESYLDRYVDLTPGFKTVVTFYILLTWLYDAFNELPYLRFRGEPGSGKTRALIVVGSICYQAFMASGASTVSPIFHTLDTFRGTLIFDEADFRFSDEKMELVKIFNNGNVRGFPVFRAVQNQRKGFDPNAFHVFGPKIIAMRHSFDDRALESRFITEEMGQRPHRKSIPLNLPESQAEEAQALRNRLLSFRFAYLQKTRIRPERASDTLSSRMNQILVPLLSITEDQDARQIMLNLAQGIETSLASEKSVLPEALLLDVLSTVLAAETSATITLSIITAHFQERYGSDFERPITPRYIGSLIRKRLHLVTYKTKGVFVMPRSEMSKVIALCEQFGIAT
jgi:hypothetical protein